MQAELIRLSVLTASFIFFSTHFSLQNSHNFTVALCHCHLQRDLDRFEPTANAVHLNTIQCNTIQMQAELIRLSVLTVSFVFFCSILRCRPWLPPRTRSSSRAPLHLSLRSRTRWTGCGWTRTSRQCLLAALLNVPVPKGLVSSAPLMHGGAGTPSGVPILQLAI